MAQEIALPLPPSGFIYRLPVLGAFLKDAFFGHEDAKYYFIANILIILFWTIYLFGYPALIIYALTAAAMMMTFIIVLTSQDLIENSRRKRRKQSQAKATKKRV